METYKFETTILENGVIQLPEISHFANSPIEIYVVIKEPKKRIKAKNKEAVDRFLNKWAGFLKESDPDYAKSSYLREKYQ